MHYIDLKRSFVPLEKDQEASLRHESSWSFGLTDWLSWQELLEHRRVVLLAEASSGKTEEFRNQAATIAAEGQAAFFVPIEDLADDGFAAALDLATQGAFESWRNDSVEEGWFFLDSVDEARLNHKSLERALRRFSNELDQGLKRARVFLSCRVSDWRGRADRDAIKRWLSVREQAAPATGDSDDAKLLAPIFRDEYETVPQPVVPSERKLDVLTIVQLAPLTAEQRSALASAAGIGRPDAFINDIERKGLDNLAERPGDLLDLVDYWKTEGQFGSLAEMTEHGISQKLAESDKHRRDNSELTSVTARQGAERLAAALTLTKTFTLRAPGHDPDPTLAAGALDPADVLEEWTDAQRNALLRRGIFAPSTYGRIRFHHRGTQEYLAARWLNGLLMDASSQAAVFELILAERYGVKTLVPSLHAIAAWLALNRSDIRDEIIRREPIVLLRHGDSRSLPLQARERLLVEYATRHKTGEISNSHLDNRRRWIFATPDMADVIHKSWEINDRDEFRIDLLCFIREGPIPACATLARCVALDEAGSAYLRIAALQALKACGDTAGLVEASRWLKNASNQVSASLGSGFAEALFPRQFAVDDLLYLIEQTTTSTSHGGFANILENLWIVCPDAPTRERFNAGIAHLCLRPPFVSSYQRVSSRYHKLARGLTPIARLAVIELRNSVPSQGLIRMLMAVERAHSHLSSDSSLSLGDLVSQNSLLQRELFWADVEESKRNWSPGEPRATDFWQVHSCHATLWKLGPKDLGWLFEDLSARSLLSDQRVALSAVVHILRGMENIEPELSRLQPLVAGRDELAQILQNFLKPAKETKQELRWRRKERLRRLKKSEERRAAEESWVRFREQLEADPSPLRNPDLLGNWETGAFRLYDLTRWLSRKTRENEEQATLQWHLLEEVFGPSVAEAYRDGMGILWRVTTPERPKRQGKQSTQSRTTVLGFFGLSIEAAEDPEWALKLDAVETERAVQYVCRADLGYPCWFNEVVDQHSTIVLPILHKALTHDWETQHGYHSSLFSHYSASASQIPDLVQPILLKIVTSKEPKSLDMLDCGLRVLQRLQLNERERRRVAQLAGRRLRKAQSETDDARLLRYFGLLIHFDADTAVQELTKWLESTPEASRDNRAETAFTEFGRFGSSVSSILPNASVASLQALVRLAYRYVRPGEDDGTLPKEERTTRHDAEMFRGALLRELLNRPGGDAYLAMCDLVADKVAGAHTIRLAELARGKAEQDAELPAWNAAEVLAFERCLVAPAKTGEGLLQLALNVLVDIQSSFCRDDATSRSLVERARNEEQIQEWLAEQMRFRSEGRYHIHREAHVAHGDKPDIIVSSTAASVEVAIEIKHGGMGWTVRNLEWALTNQLAENYLKPTNRRWGVLIVTYHGLFRCKKDGVYKANKERTWRDPKTRTTITFSDLMKRLSKLATKVVKNKHGYVEVRAFGIDTTPRRANGL